MPVPWVATSTWRVLCVCQLVRAPGVKVTRVALVRDGAAGAAASQVALAWVLAANPNVVVIPGTTRLANLKSNLGAADIALTAAETASLDALAGKVAGTRYDARGMTMVNA